jgi:hypothetical protein
MIKGTDTDTDVPKFRIDLDGTGMADLMILFASMKIGFQLEV